MQYVRVYTDATGETHFEQMGLSFTSADYAPPAPPIDVSTFGPAAAYGFLRVRSGWYGDWHPVPRRQLHVYLASELELEVSDGEVRTLRPGDVVLVEDTTGRGHISRVVGEADMLIAVIQLPDLK